MLKIQQYSIEECTFDIIFFFDVGNGKNHDSIHHRVILKVNVVQEYKANIEKIKGKSCIVKFLLLYLTNHLKIPIFVRISNN